METSYLKHTIKPHKLHYKYNPLVSPMMKLQKYHFLITYRPHTQNFVFKNLGFASVFKILEDPCA